MNSTNQSKGRILYLDSLRAFAIICVVLIHICIYFNTSVAEYNFTSFIVSFVRICVPLFFLISGALLIGKSNDNFISKRFGRVLKPFIFWVFIYFIVGVLLFNYDFSFRCFLDTLFVKSFISRHFWFIYALLGGYLIIPIINGFLESEKERGLNYLLILFIIVTALLSLKDFFDLNLNHCQIILDYLPFGLTPMLYFLLGYYLNNKKFNLSNRQMVLLSLILIAIGYILELHYLQTCNNGLNFPKQSYLTNYHLIIESCGVFLFFKYFDLDLINDKFSSLSNSKLVPIVRNLSACSFGIYLSHNFMRRYLFLEGNLFYQFTFGKPYIWIPITSMIIFFISWALIYIMSKIPILKIGSGFK